MNLIQQEINKSIIRDFYRRAVGQGDIAFAGQVVADDYIQHSPMVKPGKAGLIEALELMKQMPKPVNPSTPFMRLIAEGDYVVTNLSFGWAGKQKAVVDLFRFQDGKVAEHWDAVEDQPETTLNGRPMLNGPVAIEDLHLTAVNKKIAMECYQRVFVDQHLEALPDFVASDLVQHDPEIADGLAGLTDYLRKQANSVAIETILRVISEGNFVVIQAEGKLEKESVTIYEIFRLNTGKIVEQWRVKQVG